MEYFKEEVYKEMRWVDLTVYEATNYPISSSTLRLNYNYSITILN